MTCYNSELPIGPAGPTGPQGPPGEGGCCIERILNNIEVTTPIDTPATQSIPFNLSEDGNFVEFDFDIYQNGEFMAFNMSINSQELMSFDYDDINCIKGTINIERLNSLTILLKVNVLIYTNTPTYGVYLGSSYYYSNQYIIDPTSINFQFIFNAEFAESTLKVTKILKYNIPYL
jgi:hypothetical protein